VISPGDLAERLGEPGLRILDLRSSLTDPGAGRATSEARRIPAAVWLDLVAETSDPRDAVAGQLGSREHVAAALGRAGVAPGDEVVAYDDTELFLAARLAWACEVLGLPAVHVLDGGWPRWEREGHPVETGPAEPPAPGAGPEPAGPGRPELRLTVEQVRAGGRQLVDCRLDETWSAAGAHIPGATRLPSSSTLDPESAALRPAQELAAAAEAAGLSPDEPVALYCGGGISATQTYLALRAAGYRDLAVYDGSWAEWSSRPELAREPH
jgi:thiosulfate/3-mercaptopyruvate sulfurtransferase